MEEEDHPEKHPSREPKRVVRKPNADPFPKNRKPLPSDTCYLCGKRGNETPEGELTRDHLPPKNLFPKGRGKDLITARCCRQCNNDADEDDDYLRSAVIQYNANEIGKQVWKEKVVGSTVKKKRIREPLEKLSSSLKRIALITPRGVEDAMEGTLEAARLDRVLTRMTKGFLSLLYPEIDRNALTFQVLQGDIFKVNHPLFDHIRQHLPYFERGDGVYRCWYGVDTNYAWKGLWTHMFFDSAWHVVEQTSDRRIEML